MKERIKKLLWRAGLLESAFTLYWAARPGAILHNIPYWIKGAPDGLPIPPLGLRSRVWGAYTDIKTFLQQEDQMKQLLDVLERSGARLEEFEAILDFGCGAGRAIRQFPALKERLKRARVHGSDINREQIEWCKRHLPFAEFRLNNPAPPLSYEADTFDFIYTFSVFTHLSESQQREWMDELRRVMKPGGYLLLTTCGEAYFDTLGPQEKEAFRRGRLVVRHGDASGDAERYNECIAFHPKDYLFKELAEGFEVVEFQAGSFPENGPRLAMDHSFLRKPLKGQEADT